MADPKDFEKILRGPHKYENGTYVAIPYVHQEYPKTMDGTSNPASMVHNKIEEITWQKKRDQQRRKEKLDSALKALPRFLREFLVMIIEGITRAFIS